MIEKRLAEIPNTNGKFVASSDGKIFNTDWKGKGITKEVKQSLHHSGYLHFNMNGKPIYAHKVIMLAFKGECPEGKEIDHINGVRNDNRIENLRYVTRTENVRNPVTRERFLEANRKANKELWKNSDFRKKMSEMLIDRNKNILPNDPEWRRKTAEAAKKRAKDPEWRRKTAEAVKKACSKPVIQYTLEGQYVKRWNSTREVQRELGYKQTAISRCCCGKCKQRYGYHWEYEKN